MSAARGWLIPLLVALLIDAALVVRFQTSAGLTVSRSVVRTIGSGGCQSALLVRVLGLDNLIITDTWSQGQKARVMAAQPIAFAAAQGLMTPQTEQLIDEGIEVQTDPQLHPVLESQYAAQIRRGTSWLSGQCTPFSNPFRTSLRRLGTMQAPDGPYVVYRGLLKTDPGPGRLPKADVWLGVRGDGRLGFELLRQIPTTAVDPGSLVILEKVFTYPGTHLDALQVQPAPARASFYQQDYHDLLVTMQQAEDMGTR